MKALVILPNDKFYASLPQAQRDRIRDGVEAFCRVPLVRPIRHALQQISCILGVSPATVRRVYDELRDGADWRVFIDYRAVEAVRAARTKNPEFQQFLKKLYDEHKRSGYSAIEDLQERWRRREAIPGYDGHPGWPNLPRGWSERNLYRVQPTKTERIAFHIGLSAAAPGLPQTFSTRVGLWPMSHVQIDDLWHDNFVRVGVKGAVGRVMELDALCVGTGNKFAWGTKPRLPKALNPAQMEGLKERNVRLLLAGMLFHTGYSARGTWIMSEHGTAFIRERIARILYDRTGGLINIRYSGISGEEQAVLASWRGEGKGNPRAKAHLESLRNLIHNRLDHLPAQTGPDRQRRPETLAKMLDYEQDLLELAARLPESRRALLIHPTLEYHAHFLPLLGDLYRAINGRTNHRLEGWSKCEYLTNEYRTAPQALDWLGERELLALPEESRRLLHSLVRAQPQTYSRTRQLSPAEVYDPARPTFLHIGPDVVCDLLLDDLAREEKVKGSYFRFRDIEIDPEEMIFEARILAPGATREVELPEGEKYLVFVNPFAPEYLFVCGARKQFLGLARRVHGVSPLDEAATIRAWGHAAARTADRLAPARLRHAGDSSAHAEMVATNEALADTARDFTPDEKAASRARRANTAGLDDFAGEPSDTEPRPIASMDDFA